MSWQIYCFSWEHRPGMNLLKKATFHSFDSCQFFGRINFTEYLSFEMFKLFEMTVEMQETIVKECVHLLTKDSVWWDAVSLFHWYWYLIWCTCKLRGNGRWDKLGVQKCNTIYEMHMRSLHHHSLSVLETFPEILTKSVIIRQQGHLTIPK